MSDNSVTQQNTADLNARLLEAHAAGDKQALVTLYAQAADGSADPGESWFFLTQAYVFALELDHPDLPALKARLVAAGRESD